jgi:pyruvate kinase
MSRSTPLISRPNFTQARTKIVATVGPACESEEMLAELINQGVDVFRINTAHGKQADFERMVGKIRSAQATVGYAVGILLDLSGPKIRLGQLAQDPYNVETGAKVRFIRGDVTTETDVFTCNYVKLIDELNVDNRVMLTDGRIALRVIEKQRDQVICRVEMGGEIRSRQGINLPGVALSVSAMRPEDVENALWAARNEIDFISLSFVRSPQDIYALKNLIASMESSAIVVAKIEKREALDQLEAIVEAADAVMVARGDLGVEIDVAETPVAQKRIIQVCREKMKPVIVATQMLESMHHSNRPTRAEASDVANAVLDGADACMLSGETAIGDFPIDAVAMMNRILYTTEEMLKDAPTDNRFKTNSQVPIITFAVTHHASSIAQTIGAKLVVVVSRSGNTAWVKAKQRNYIPTLGVSDVETTLRRMSLFWGIMPLRVPAMDDPQGLVDEVNRWGCASGRLQPGDIVVYVTGTGVMSDTHNLLMVQQVPVNAITA